MIKTHLSIDMLPEQVHFSKQQMNISAFEIVYYFKARSCKFKGVAEESENNICDKEPQRCCGKNCLIMFPKSGSHEDASELVK